MTPATLTTTTARRAESEHSMNVVYQDELGIVCVEINTEEGITFDGVYAYFFDATNLDYRVPIQHLVKIG